jgi:hypothetical protein
VIDEELLELLDKYKLMASDEGTAAALTLSEGSLAGQ